ncbi:fluoride efflux transporter CrcB [Virgibacillus siamensis]|uniref:Fluoride-specific ion channel FluC n=1 Tax=Virgibacillus siamensis TaxID=480071 RepID=A0ABP3QE69_9BACI
MSIYLAVGIGGMAGAVARYAVSILIVAGSGFPFATLLVNLTGCFLLSFLFNQSKIKSILSRNVFTALGTGLLGSFTTFSTFTIETIKLWHEHPGLAITYSIISVVGGLLFCYAGFRTAGKQVDR